MNSEFGEICDLLKLPLALANGPGYTTTWALAQK
jgi:hypothetical protein